MSLEALNMTVQLDTETFNRWDADATKYALETATKLYTDFHENNIVFVESTSFDISKEFQAYRMHKVFIILEANKIFMYHKIYKRKNKIITTMELEDIFDSDDESENPQEH